MTHEQTYYKWLERAWRGGLWLFVTLHVENRVLCEIYPYEVGSNSCDEMESVRLQIRRLRELQNTSTRRTADPARAGSGS